MLSLLLVLCNCNALFPCCIQWESTYLLSKSLCVVIRQFFGNNWLHWNMVDVHVHWNIWNHYEQPEEERVWLILSGDYSEDGTQTEMHQSKLFCFTVRGVLFFCIFFFQPFYTKAQKHLEHQKRGLTKLKICTELPAPTVAACVFSRRHNAMWVEILLGSTFTTFNL